MKINAKNLTQLASKAKTFSYDRSKLKHGFVHIGLGAFHRGHQQRYIHDYIEATGDTNWGIVGINFSKRPFIDNLKEQDCLYTVVEKDSKGTHYQIIGSLMDVLCVSDDKDSARIMDVLCSPDTKILTTTVTEKGYHLSVATKELIVDEHIKHDIEHPETPKTLLGLVSFALHKRHKLGVKPFTALCCDNLPQNGRTFKTAVIQFTELYDKSFAKWISENVEFPCTMVDRIVPAITENDVQEINGYGLEDKEPIFCESFKQWAIEDRFPLGRPALEKVSSEVIFTDDVVPFEDMKLRMLNGSHSTMAYLGHLAGFEYIYQVMSDNNFVKLVTTMMEREVIPTLNVPKSMDIQKYKNELIERFKNTSLKHKTYQIAMDGSQKLPQRILHTVMDNIAAHRSVAIQSLSVAGWIRYTFAVTEKGESYVVQDPLAARFVEIYNSHKNDTAAIVKGFLAVSEVFPASLANNGEFSSLVKSHLDELLKNGSYGVVKQVTSKF